MVTIAIQFYNAKQYYKAHTASFIYYCTCTFVQYVLYVMNVSDQQSVKFPMEQKKFNIPTQHKPSSESHAPTSISNHFGFRPGSA
jgi:hypothetical protein